MLNEQYSKTLYQLAQAQKVKSGLHRSVVISTSSVIQSIGIHLYPMIDKIENISLTDPEILPHLIGEDEAKLLEQKCLTTYWAWRVLAEVPLKPAAKTPVEWTLNEIRSNTKATFREKLNIPVSQMEQKVVSKLTAYGILLWDGSNNQIVPNPIFF
jgi:hypothetical protein